MRQVPRVRPQVAPTLRKPPQTPAVVQQGMTAVQKPLMQSTTQPPPEVKKPSATGPLTLHVYSKADKDEIGIETLVGEYVEMGTNHGKKFFKRKKGAEGIEEVTVFLYFWDNRDGADFGGWWFGDKVGGAQVWSRCEKADMLPPASGWRIPWDGPVQNALVVESQMQQAKPAVAVPAKVEAKEETKTEVADVVKTEPELDERVQRATDRVVLAEIEATQALESSSAMMEGEVSDESLQVVEELLVAQQTTMTESHKSLAAEIIEARKVSPKSVAALSKLTPRLRSVQASLVAEIARAKQLSKRKLVEAEEKQKRAHAEEFQLQAEQRDAKALEESLPVAMDVVTKAEDMIEVVITTASPLAVEFAEEMSESVSNLLQETEEAAGKAHEAIQAARKEVNSKISAATNFAPEARKVALAEFSSLQDKLNESEKKLAPYLRIRKEYEHKLSAKKVMTEVASKLGSVEIEVDKVTSLLMGSSSTSRDEIKAAEASLAPVMHSLTTAMKFVEERMQGAQGALKDDLSQMQERGKETEKRVSSFRLQLRSKMDQLQLQNLLSQGLEKTQHAEDLLEKTVSAETPLVKGLDELEKEEASEAIAASEASAKAAEVAASQAKAFLKAKLVDAKSFPDATRKPTVDELIQLQNRVDAVSQKVAAFKRESAQRKTVLLLREVTEKVDIVETRVQQAVRAAEPLSMEKLEEVPTSTLKQITDQTLEAEKAAALAFADARKALVTKQRDGQAWESPSFAAELTKLQGKLNSAKQELDKQRKLTLQAEKLWKSKELVKDKEEAMKQVESEVERVEILTTPLGDERPSTESIKEMDAAVNAVQQSLNEVVSSLEVAQHTAQGSLKVQLVKLLVRTKKSQEKLNEIKALTQEQRERVACEQILKEARAKLVGLDEAFQKVSDAETPYLKGDEILAVDEATQAVADSEAAAAAVQQAIHATRTFLTAKSLEVRGFVDAVAKMGLQEIGLLASKNEEGAERLAQFKKETEGRKRIAQHQQALAKASDAEEAVQKTILASTPLAAKNVDEIQPEEAHEFCERLLEAEKEAQAKLNDARKFLMDRQRERKGQSELSELSQLLARLNSAQVDLAKAKTTASEHEQKFVARMLMQQADEIAREVDSELEKAVEAAAPLTVDGGKMFVAASMTKMILEALTEYMNEKGLTKESLFQQMSKGSTDGRCARADCLAFLEKIPEMCGRPDLAVSSEHGSAIFDQLDSKAEGSISSKEFNDAFRERYICIHGTSVTDGFEVAASKTVAKLEADEVVEALAEPRSHDTSGVMRVHVRLLKDDTTGWVTMQGSEGTMYLGPFTAYASFMKSLDKAMTSAMSTSAKAANFINQKGEDVQDCKQGPLADAKVELTKLRSQVSVMQMKLDQLKKRVEEGKKEHSKREELERKKQEEKKDRRAASLILKAISDKVSNAQAGLSKMEGQASPLTSVSEADLGKVSSPLEVSKASAASFDEVLSLVAEAKECIKAHEGKVLKAPKGPWSELKQAMSKQQREVFVIGKKANEIMSKVRILCNNFIASKQGEVAQAFRKQIQQRGISIDKLYDELAGKKGDQIPQEKFSKALDKLPDLTLSCHQSTRRCCSSLGRQEVSAEGPSSRC